MIDVTSIAQGLEDDRDPFHTLARFIYPFVQFDPYLQTVADAINTSFINGDYILAGQMQSGSGFEAISAESLEASADMSLDIGAEIVAADIAVLAIPIIPF